MPGAVAGMVNGCCSGRTAAAVGQKGGSSEAPGAFQPPPPPPALPAGAGAGAAEAQGSLSAAAPPPKPPAPAPRWVLTTFAVADLRLGPTSSTSTSYTVRFSPSLVS